MTYAAVQNFIARVQERGRVIQLGYARAFARFEGFVAAAFCSFAVALATRVLPRRFFAPVQTAFALRARYAWLQRGAVWVFAQARAKQARHACCRLNKAPPRFGRVCPRIKQPAIYPPPIRRDTYAQFFIGRCGFQRRLCPICNPFSPV